MAKICLRLARAAPPRIVWVIGREEERAGFDEKPPPMRPTSDAGVRGPSRDRLRTGMCADEPQGCDFRRVPRGPSHACITFGTTSNAAARHDTISVASANAAARKA